MFEWLWGKKKKVEVKVTNPEKKTKAKPRWEQTSEHRIAPEFENECNCECDECDCHDDEW